MVEYQKKLAAMDAEIGLASNVISVFQDARKKASR
jgi:hypothetical protein